MEKQKEHESAAVIMYNLTYQFIYAAQLMMWNLANAYNDKHKKNDSARIENACKFFKAAVHELETFDEDFSKLDNDRFEQLRRDANELISMNMLYFYQTYQDINNMYETFKFLRGLGPINERVDSLARYFRDKSK